jgi:UDP-N-acetylglucosamine--N-acetylmuramyl-(pentapeptide) pyrophosphoryl-undecaprenol N-acetylglucosamine transferase
MKKFKFIISGGGTGGHIFPAISIADSLKRQAPNCEILFVGAENKMEMQRVPAAGYTIKGITVSGFQRKMSVENLKFPFKLLKGLWQSYQIINQFKPDAAIGVGGFAAGPLLQIASWKNIPIFIQEQNSYPGVTNKLLASKAVKIFTAYHEPEKYFSKEKIILTGNPIRKSAVDIANKKSAAIEFFGLDPNRKIVFITGGSLGAKTINESIASSIQALSKNNIQLIWQTGKSFEEKAIQLTKDAKNIYVSAFIEKMNLAFAAADIIVGRAGAGSISEFAIIAKPCILIPSPNVAEDHQTKNAMALVNKKAAILIKDNDAREKLGKLIIETLNDEALQKSLSANIQQFAKPNADQQIANEILNFLNA